MENARRTEPVSAMPAFFIFYGFMEDVHLCGTLLKCEGIVKVL